MRYVVLLAIMAALLISCGGAPVARTVPATETPAARATAVPVPTKGPTGEPTPAPATETAPAADTPAARYIAIAQSGVTIPAVRTADMPKGEWKADVVDVGNGPEVTLTMPVGVGLSTAQMLRQAKRQVAQAVKAIFDADPAVARVSVTGTLPDGAGNTELGAVSIFVDRASYTRWDGIAENLGNWRIPPRYQ